jgi:hypothetical protein
MSVLGRLVYVEVTNAKRYVSPGLSPAATAIGAALTDDAIPTATTHTQNTAAADLKIPIGNFLL